MALQQAHMHQSYVQSVGGGNVGAGTPPALPFLPLQCAPGGQGAGRSRPHSTPLRHAIVSSTTHPHHLHGMSEMNLRGLLNAQAQAQAQTRAARPGHANSHAMQAYHQIMGYSTNAFNANMPNAGGRRSGGSGGLRTPSPAPPTYHHPQQHQHQMQAKWHIPQHALANGGFEVNMMSPTGAREAADFKIMIGRVHPPATGTPPRPSLVTSTNPKTPSPSLNGGASLELDKVCAESVQDLMATIAKLDSNGVQVLPESEPAPVSSTEDGRGTWCWWDSSLQ